MRRRLVLLAVGIVVWCVAGGSAHADQFQLMDQRAGAFIRYIKVTVDGRAYYTDSLGRVEINLRPGTYPAEISYKGGIRSFDIVIDGRRRLKRITID